jgi:acetaldehyde dehydrogenase / alcohol dehydrogenase
VTMTVGTGFFGRSSLTESLQPDHLVQWTRVAYAVDPSQEFGDYTGLEPWSALPAPEPMTAAAPAAVSPPGGERLSREELRRLILAELRETVRS